MKNIASKVFLILHHKLHVFFVFPSRNIINLVLLLFKVLMDFHLSLIQVVFAGDAAVGKTSFINRITKV